MTDITLDRTDAVSDPIGALTASTRALAQTEPTNFPRIWILRALLTELAKYSIEDDYVDRESLQFKHLKGAYERLANSDDWLDPKLSDYLIACRTLAISPEVKGRQVQRYVKNNGHSFSLIETRSDDITPIMVSNTESSSVSIIERTLGHPTLCTGLVDAFVARIDMLVRDEGVTHLAFIEKEAGPVGAITMMSSLVRATSLPACIYRETHWAERASIVAHKPVSSARIAVIYDLIVTGAGICNAADQIAALTGARTVGTVVLCGYQERRDHLQSPGGQTIRVEALDWDETDRSPHARQAAGGVGEVRSVSASRAAPREEAHVKSKVDNVLAIPPGSYTKATLPPIGESAQAIVDRIRARAAEAAPASPRHVKAARAAQSLRVSDKVLTDPRLSEGTVRAVFGAKPSSPGRRKDSTTAKRR